MAKPVGRGRASLGIVAAAALAGCLDRNPQFEEPLPTTSDSSGADSTGDPTASTTSQGTTGSLTDPSTSATSTVGPMTTTPLGACGDGQVGQDEECDDGLKNADDAACTSACKQATCGDGLIHKDIEFCEDLNDDPADGCVACFVPHVCKEVLDRAPGSPTGLYVMDPDGPGPGPLVPAYCDMTLDGGGWTRVERSPLADPIARALFADVEVNYDAPASSRYRMGRAAMNVVQQHSNELWIDCGGTDHLWTDSDFLFEGEGAPNPCDAVGAVLYKEAQLSDIILKDVELCTGFTGLLDGDCAGAWRIDEVEQMLCGLSSTPWIDGQPFSAQNSDIFAADPTVQELELHDCHKAGAIRAVMMR